MMTSADIARMKAKVKAKIDEMSEYEFEEMARSEESFFDWLGDFLRDFGVLLVEVARTAWDWFKSWFD